MQKLQFDSGVQEYRLGSGVLRFNPADPNLYARFLEASESIQTLSTELTAALPPEPDGKALLALMTSADRTLKERLGWVFGADFDELLGGVNLLAVGKNGKRLISELLDVLTPILTDGAERCAAEQSAQAVAKAQARRKSQ